jgi:hypothetical protein
MITNPPKNQNPLRMRREAVRVAKNPINVKRLGWPHSPNVLLMTLKRKGSSRCPTLLLIISLSPPSTSGRELTWGNFLPRKITFLEEKSISIIRVQACLPAGRDPRNQGLKK